MSVIRVFRNYIEEYHSHLATKDWIVDVRAISVDKISNRNLKEVIPVGFKGELMCCIFFYDGGASNFVCLFQDKQGLQNLGIGLLKEGKLIKPISFV